VAVRRCLFHRFAGGNALAGQLSTAQTERCERRQGARQNREGESAGITDATSNPDKVVVVVMNLPEPAAVADDGLASARRTTAREQAQRNHPGSELSSVSGSAIKRITAGVKARRDRFRQVSICWPGLHPPGKVSFERKEEYSFASAVATCLATLAGLEPHIVHSPLALDLEFASA
jgi:hypothetical protein